MSYRTFKQLVSDLLLYVQQENSPPFPQIRNTPDLKQSPASHSFSKKVEQENLSPIQSKESFKKSSKEAKKGGSSLFELIRRALPEMRLTDEIPSDAPAKQRAELYKQKAAQIGLLAFDKAQLPFLTALARAISDQLGPAKIWEVDQISLKSFHEILDHCLRLIIATHAGIESNPKLKASFKESPKPTLFGIPLVLLAPIAEYENNPQLKRMLWHHLRELSRSIHK